MKDQNKKSRRPTVLRLSMLIAWLALAAGWVGCASMPEPDNRPRTASDFIGQPRPMP